MKSSIPKPVKVINECVALQIQKSNDYQNPNSRIKQIDYYPRGVLSIMEMIHTKTTRMWSVLEAAESGKNPNFESLEDSAKDLINYSTFFVAYSRGKMDGQDPNRDFLNRPVKGNTHENAQ